jgi:hypothetical protein
LVRRPRREEAVLLEDTREAVGIPAAVAHILRHLMEEEVRRTLVEEVLRTSLPMQRPTLAEAVALVSLLACHMACPTPR